MIQWLKYSVFGGVLVAAAAGSIAAITPGQWSTASTALIGWWIGFLLGTVAWTSANV